MNNFSELKVCSRCGNMFIYSGFGKCICAKCKEEDETEFHLVKDYIFQNVDATLQEVAENTKVRIGRIKSYLREGRLIIPDHSSVFIECEHCGTPIKFGRVCRSCADSLSNEMKLAMKLDEYTIGDKPEASARMRFIDNNKI